eukprot:TRINITY_DN24450_c0_g1_i1.p1 TRINITY_DN24450_c0_g1~~TRINITY_DN24450_c0_g1_i1.p1  ORF type:complete len:345 (+),score=57.76 TRINITY_DN24450_c0_g1_i1:119-1153(+)
MVARAMLLKLLLFLLAVGCGAIMQVGPTAAPTAVPTSAPSAPPESPTSAAPASPTSAPTSPTSPTSTTTTDEFPGGSAPTSAPATETATSSTTTATMTTSTTTTWTSTSNTTTTALTGAITSFVVRLFVENATHFKEDDYIASVAAAARLPAYRVIVTSVHFVVFTSYKFAGTASITVAQLRMAVAACAGVPDSDVNVTSTAGRRLSGGGLLGQADVEVSTMSGTEAEALVDIAYNVTMLAEELGQVTGKTIEAPINASLVQTIVVVLTEIYSFSQEGVEPPAADKIASEMSIRSRSQMTVEISDVAYFGTTTTPEDTEEEWSKAFRASASAAAMAVVLAYLAV